MQHRLKTQAKALESAFVTFSLRTKEDLSGAEDTIKQGAFTFLPHEIDLMNVTSFMQRHQAHQNRFKTANYSRKLVELWYTEVLT